MIEVKNLTKVFSTKKKVPVKAVDSISCFKLDENGLVFILGKSGSGKTTLLNLIGGLDQYDNGDILINGRVDLQKIIL
jgi:ABC-type lipoprotein export system ATPase subunit